MKILEDTELSKNYSEPQWSFRLRRYSRNGKSTENLASHVTLSQCCLGNRNGSYHKITAGSNSDRIKQAYRQYSLEELLSQVNTDPILEPAHSAFSCKDKQKDKCWNMTQFIRRSFVTNHKRKVRGVKIHSWFYHLLVFFLQQLHFLSVLFFQGFYIPFSVHGLWRLRKR